MTGWQIALVVLAVLWLLSLIRLGAAVSLMDGIFSLAVKVGPLRLSVFPRKEKGEKPKKEKPKKEKKPKKETPPTEKPKKTAKDMVALVMDMLPVVGEAAGRLRRKIRIDTLTLHIIWGAAEPAEAALGYGRANAAMGMIWPVLDHNFRVKEHDLAVDVDYGRSSPEVTARASVTMTLGQLTAFGIIYGIKLLMIWSRSGRRSARRQEVQNV